MFNTNEKDLKESYSIKKKNQKIKKKNFDPLATLPGPQGTPYHNLGVEI